MNVAQDTWEYVKQAEALPNNIIMLTFEDGKNGTYDMTPLVQKWEIYAPLKDPRLFKELRVEGGTVTWPGDIDIAPEELYWNCNTIDNN